MGRLFVKTARERIDTLGVRYGPQDSAAPANRIRALRYGYAPASPMMSTSWARIVPSERIPVRYFMVNGCRLVLACIDSCRSQIMRTGRRVCQTSSARYGSTVMSSLPPKPPPMYEAMTRTLFCGRSRISASSMACSMTWVDTRSVTTSCSTQPTPHSGSR